MSDFSGLAIFLEIFTYFIAWGTFLFTLWRYFGENPILKHYVYRCYHYYEENDSRSTLNIDMIIDNVGERSTTITAYEIIEITPKKLLDKAMPTKRKLVTLGAHDSKYVRLSWNFKDIVLPTSNIPISAKVHHTHNGFPVKSISRPRESLSEWEMRGIPRMRALHVRGLLKRTEHQAYVENIPEWFKEGLDEYTLLSQRAYTTTHARAEIDLN